ncbi:PepSY domain-containing protein [Alcaligenes faecalis]|nr:PepSY domain-containing protein [Alcaligenes faecalis]
MTMLLRNSKRFTYLLHRWSGVITGVFMTLWFVSGIVMLFVGYPKLFPNEHLAKLEPIKQQACCIGLDTVFAALPQTNAKADSIRLVVVASKPQYQVTQGSHIYAVDAQSGALIPPVDESLALSSVASYLKASTPTYEGLVHADIWTRSSGLNLHRPLHKIRANDPANTIVYVSSRTGEVVMQADAWIRRWNYVGAWLHWLYMFRGPSPDPIWHWLVVILSLASTITTVTGTIVGIWRWRFRGRYRSGARSPYPSGVMRWHHVTGLLFCGITLTWIFSGLMSMNPFGILSAKSAPDQSAYQGQPLVPSSFGRSAPDFLKRAPADSLKEIRWLVVGGHPYLIGRTANNQPITMSATQSDGAIVHELDLPKLLDAAQRLFAYPITSVQQLDSYDMYYYARASQAMRGAREKPLPILRVQFGDPSASWAHIDPRTGSIESLIDRRQRMGRWLFELLHSWDLPVLLAAGWWRDAALILFSLGGFALSATGVWVACRRVQHTFKSRRY